MYSISIYSFIFHCFILFFLSYLFSSTLILLIFLVHLLCKDISIPIQRKHRFMVYIHWGISTEILNMGINMVVVDILEVCVHKRYRFLIKNMPFPCLVTKQTKKLLARCILLHLLCNALHTDLDITRIKNGKW